MKSSMLKTFPFQFIWLFFILIYTNVYAEGLSGKYYDNNNFTSYQFTRTDSTIDFAWYNGSPSASINSDTFSIQWTGYIYIPEDAIYTFSFAHDDGINVTIDGTSIYSNGNWTGGANNYVDATSKYYTKGYYPITINFQEDYGGAYMRFAWRNNKSIPSRVTVPTSSLFTSIPIPAPQINLQGNGLSISNGDITPSTLDATDFGNVGIGNSLTHTFTIQNAGTLPLTLTGTPLVSSSGDFTITSQPSSTIAASGSTTFDVTFTPSSTGTKTSTISIANNVAGSSPYTFSLTGEGIDYCSPLRDSATLSALNTFYTNSSHYNDSDWNVGPSSSAEYRAYHFTVASEGTVDIKLYDVDNNQARFSVAKSACPSTQQNLTSSQLDFNSAGDFYVYIYYVSGSHNDIEHRLDVTFTPVPVATAVDDNYDIAPNTAFSDNILTNDLGDSISITSHTDPSYGTLTLDLSSGAFTYIPDANSTGSDFFTYDIIDKDGATDSATVTFTTATQYDGFHPFVRVNPEETRYVRGNYAIAGNTVTCLTAVTSGYAGANDVCHGDTDYSNITSNMNTNKYLDIDSDTTTWNSTSSYINLPTTYDPSPNHGILWAGLFWQGRISNDNDDVKHYAKVNGTSYNFVETKGGANIVLENTDANKIKLKINNGNYNDIQASTVYKEESDGDVTYAAYADVTSQLQNANLQNGKQVFTVANLTTEEGHEWNPGLFGGWSLIVIYAEDLTGEVRNITVLSGFDEVKKPSAAFPIKGLKLPEAGAVSASLSLFAGEGETLYHPDWVKISDDNQNYDFFLASDDNSTDRENIFDAVFSNILRDKIPGKYNDLAKNNNGVDVDTFDVSKTIQGYRNANPNLDTLYMQWSSGQDYITPSMITFATQLYEPKLCYDYSIKQDGQYLQIDRTTSTLASVIANISSSPLEIEVYLRNKEADLPAEGISIRTDLNTTLFSQTGNIYTSNVNGSLLIDRGTPTISNPLCDYSTTGNNDITNNGCTDGHNIRKGNGELGANDYVYTKFTIDPNITKYTDVNESLGLSIDYYITVSGYSIPYLDYVLGGPNVPICPPSDAYEPAFGQFNVVANSSTYNNLVTQISRKPFNVDVIFDADPSTGRNDAPTSDINTTVFVEIIDLDSFGDLNASCANPDANKTQAVFLPLTLDPANYQSLIPPQPNNYFNVAVANATYRVWYFTDNNDTLIQNWTATTDNNGTNLISISGLYDSTIHTQCTAECDSDPTTTTCFRCIRSNYAHPLCARDNFSIRPEAFDIRIYDINKSLDSYDIATDPTNTKNTTKKDLSTYYNQLPTLPVASGLEMELAAVYDYRVDINATGYDTLSGIPGYSRAYSSGTDYNASFVWNGPTATPSYCNDTNDTVLDLRFSNGVAINSEQNNSNVGQYLFNVIDKKWTEVDWSFLSHHDTSYNGGFDPALATDCTLNSSNTLGTFHGCDTTSNHASGNNGYIYRDIPIQFHPYMFDITTNVLTGSTQKPVSEKPFVYMADINKTGQLDENVSVHLDTTFIARGFGSASSLSNYVDRCYAQPNVIDVNKSQTTSTKINFLYNIYDINSTGQRTNTISGIILNGDTNLTNLDQNITVNIPSSYWNKDMNGVLNLEISMNFERNSSLPVNPEDINYVNIDMNDSNILTADLNTSYNADGNRTVNTVIHHYFGRTEAPKVSILCNRTPCLTGNDPSNVHNTKVLTYFSVYCNPNDPGAVCNPNLGGNLPFGSIQTNDIRWWTNNYHDRNITTNVNTPTTDGIIGNIPAKNGVQEVNARTTVNNYTYEPQLQYSGINGLPYEAVMDLNSSAWLIYDENNESATTNTFTVEFIGQSGWSGRFEENSTTDTQLAPPTNRRIMW
jgi:hypothetical protein